MSEKDSLILIKKYIDEYLEVENDTLNCEIYSNEISLGGKLYNVGGVFFDKGPNSIANEIFDKDETVDILLLINIKNKVVILRKKEGCEINLGKLAKQLSKGGGREDIAGCILNDKIINLTKLLK